MATISFDKINKVFRDGTEAIRDFSLEVADGELLVMVGPSGCGKSTLLRLLAGLEEVSSGQLYIAGKEIKTQPAQQRNLAMVFQNYALYPHMTVKANLEFPLRMMGLEREERQKRLLKTAELLHLTDLLERRPKQLSGGQRQRVAMGRAIIREPRAFLMDEPLSNLDAKLRVKIRTEIAALQQRLQTTTLYVTHDQVEALTLGHRVAVINNGRLQQIATAENLYQTPANIFVAGFIGNPGMNIFEAGLQHQTDKGFALTWGDHLLPLPRQNSLQQLGEQLHHVRFVGLRPEAFCLSSQAAVSISAEVTAVEVLGHEQLVYFKAEVKAIDSDCFQVGGAPVKRDQMVARLSQSISVRAGDTLELGIDLKQLTLFDASGRALIATGLESQP